MKAEQFLKKEYGANEKYKTIELENVHGKKQEHYFCSILEQYAENEIINFINWLSKNANSDQFKNLNNHIDKVVGEYKQKNN